MRLPTYVVPYEASSYIAHTASSFLVPRPIAGGWGTADCCNPKTKTRRARRLKTSTGTVSKPRKPKAASENGTSTHDRQLTQQIQLREAAYTTGSPPAWPHWLIAPWLVSKYGAHGERSKRDTHHRTRAPRDDDNGQRSTRAAHGAQDPLHPAALIP